MQKLDSTAAEGGARLFRFVAHPRLVDGKPTKNHVTCKSGPTCWNRRKCIWRKWRPACIDGFRWDSNAYASERSGARTTQQSPDAGIRALAVFNPIHYLELPELFAGSFAA
jgi:hypothetical protein